MIKIIDNRDKGLGVIIDNTDFNYVHLSWTKAKGFYINTKSVILDTKEKIDLFEHELNQVKNWLGKRSLVLPKFKVKETVKRKSNYTDTYIFITIDEIQKSGDGYVYISTNGIPYSERELISIK